MIAFAALAVAAAVPVYNNMPENVAIQAVHNYGACAVSRTPQGARQMLSLDYNSKDYEKQIRRYVRGHDYCMPFNGRMSSSGLLFAGAVAEALLKSDIKPGELPQRIAFNPQRETIAARGPSEAMALCTVLNAPQATARILGTEPATPEEIEAMKPLGGVLGECLKQNVQLTLNKPALRALLALAAWRIATTPPKVAAQ